MTEKPPEVVFADLQRDKEAKAKPPSAATVKELSPAEAAKEEGNAAFKRGDYAEVPLCSKKWSFT
jgi:hypothetical protein